MRGEGDVAASVTVLSDDRVDFELLPPIVTRHVFAFFVQPPLSDLRDIFEQPFDFRLFWGAAGLYIMTFLITTALRWLRRRSWQIVDEKDADLEFRNNVGFILISSVCLKSKHSNHKCDTSPEVLLNSEFVRLVQDARFLPTAVDLLMYLFIWLHSLHCFLCCVGLHAVL